MGATTGDLELANLAELALGVPDAPIGEVTTGVTLARARVESVPRLAVEGLSLVAGAGATLEISGLAAADDVDPDGVYGVRRRGRGGLLPLLEPGRTAWLKYRLGADGRAGLAASPGEAAAHGALVLADYRAHALADNAREAVLDDLARPRLVVRTADLSALAPGDALALLAEGRVTARVELAWSDLVAAAIGRLEALLGAAAPLAFGLDLGGSVVAEATVEDEYALVFEGLEGGEVRAGVFRTAGRRRALGAGLAVEVGLADPRGAQQLLAALLESVAGEELERVDALLARLDLGRLSPAEQELAQRLAERLGLDSALDRLDVVARRWHELEAGLDRLLDEVARATVGTRFHYDYRRVAQGESLLEVVLRADAARAVHGALVRGEVGRAVSWLRANPRRVRRLERYLGRTSLERERSCGFTLALGPWLELSSSNRSRLEMVVEEDFAGDRQVAYLGLRSYEGRLLADADRWTVDLRAESRRPAPTPLAADLELGLGLSLEHEHRRARRWRLERAVDEAVAWRVVEPGDAEAIVAEARAAAGRRKVLTRVELVVGDGPFRALLAALPEAGDAAFARALARALPWRPRPEARAVVADRERLYAPVWLAYLSNRRFSARRAAAATAARVAKAARAAGLRGIEGAWPPCAEWSLAAQIERNPRTRSSWGRFAAGCTALERAIAEGEGHEVVRDLFPDLEGLWRQSLTVRALGALVAELVAASPAGLGALHRSFTIELPTAGRALVFASSR